MKKICLLQTTMSFPSKKLQKMFRFMERGNKRAMAGGELLRSQPQLSASIYLLSLLT